MNILPILYHLRGAILGNRQTGSTTFIRTIARKGGAVICESEQHAGQMMRSQQDDRCDPPLAVSMMNTSGLTRLEGRRIPLVFDNHAIQQLCAYCINQIERITEDFKLLRNLHDDSKKAWSQELQGLSKTLASEQAENWVLVDVIKAGKKQVQALENEKLDLQRQLITARAAIRHIRVTRGNKKRRR